MEKHFTFIIDRFEEDWAVLEYDGQLPPLSLDLEVGYPRLIFDETYNVPRALLPDNAKEGDVLKISLEIDQEETEKRKEAIRKLEDELFE